MEQLKIISNLSKRLIQRDYRNFIDTHISENLKEGNSKPLFQLISRSKKGDSGSNIAQLHNCSNDSEMAISFAESFKSVFTADDDCVPQVLSRVSSVSYTPHANTVLSEQGILALLNSLNYRKGCGPDNLSPAILKFLANYIAPILTLILSTLSLLVVCQMTGIGQMLCQYIKRVTEKSLLTIDPFP